MKKFKDEVRKFTKEYVNKLFRDINTNLKRRFKNEFETDQNGKMRNWVSIEEAQIHEFWASSLKSVEKVLKRFRFIEIPYDAFKINNNFEN